MWILGHRGAPWEAPENTLASFALARAAGADGVELDVRLCATGEVVCCHDVTLHRLAGAAVRVRATSLATLRAWDLGRCHRLCTLDDALALWRTDGVVNVEIKSDDVDLAALVDATARTLARHPRTRVLVSSFSPFALEALRAVAPSVQRGLLLAPSARVEAFAAAPEAWRARPHAVHPWHGDVTAARVSRWRALGLDVHVWTVDDDRRARALAAAGVTSVITNVPGAMRRTLSA